MQQRSLFPDGFELQEEALAALRELEVERAAACVRRARQLDAPLVDLGPLEAALQWLSRHVPAAANVEAAAATFARLPAAVGGGDLRPLAAGIADIALARYLARRRPPGVTFVGEARAVPSPLVDLVLGDGARARAGFEELIGAGNADRADLWAYHGDACVHDGRPDEANASYVRALALGPRCIDVFRLRHARLRGLLAESQARSRSLAAIDGLLAEAWTEGVVAIARGNAWLSAKQRDDLLAATATEPRWRLSVLVYLDRSAPAGEVDVARREQMAELDPELSRRFVAAVARAQA